MNYKCLERRIINQVDVRAFFNSTINFQGVQKKKETHDIGYLPMFAVCG